MHTLPLHSFSEDFIFFASMLRSLQAHHTFTSTTVRQAPMRLDGLDFEMKTDERKHETFEILYKVVEAAQALWIPES